MRAIGGARVACRPGGRKKSATWIKEFRPFSFTPIISSHNALKSGCVRVQAVDHPLVEQYLGRPSLSCSTASTARSGLRHVLSESDTNGRGHSLNYNPGVQPTNRAEWLPLRVLLGRNAPRKNFTAAE